MPVWSPDDCLICRRKVVETDMRGDCAAVSCPVCGRYDVLDDELLVRLRDSVGFKGERHLLSGIARRARDRGERRVRFSSENVDLLLASPDVPRTPMEKMDALLASLAQKSGSFGERIRISYGQDYSMAFAVNPEEMRSLVSTLQMEGHLTGDPDVETYDLSVTLGGWRRVEEMSKTGARSDQAFVAMWADESMQAIWRDGIRHALVETGYKPLCENWSEHSGKIDDKIIADIRQSGLLVVDLTGHRNSVYFEAGFAFGLGMPIIYTCKDCEGEETGFDIRQYKQIRWKDPADLNEKLVNRIRAMGLDRPQQQERQQ